MGTPGALWSLLPHRGGVVAAGCGVLAWSPELMNILRSERQLVLHNSALQHLKDRILEGKPAVVTDEAPPLQTSLPREEVEEVMKAP